MTEPLNATIQAAADGDAEAWRRLVDAYSGRVYGLVYRQCGNPELAEEITQATFVTVVGKLGAYHERGRFEAWLFRIALNRLRDEMRRRKRQAETVDDVEHGGISSLNGREVPAPPPQMLAQRERLEWVRRAVDRLPEADRELLHLRYTAQLSFARIAETLDQPLGTVLARGHRALKKLKRILGEDEDPAG
jgi:RNA polymerase sigma-70 factor (ECF subfamily)